ncbi:hypothetical protein DIPPA_02156 [Diplonema papillatum]|nr:hypothetical protein DIPPA_04030 [Diplonema papillatum]KAJ9448144.1 hypothetical protein DIPPA_25210 [Diplonema papillatum]KAJ9469659.1 hypothetical protein DIPPA_02156 [Diplonema papillatum]
MKNGLEVRNRLGRRSPPVDAMEFLWAVLFVFPELALAYLQGSGALPRYTILAEEATSSHPPAAAVDHPHTSEVSSRSADSEDAVPI